MREVLYYNGGASVCLLIDEQTKTAIARGISICSPSDQFVKKVGRAKARGRALQAIAHKQSVNAIPVQQRVIAGSIEYFASYQPEMTDFEKQLIAKFK